MLVPVVAVGVFSSTLLGGTLALHLRDRLHLILGFSAGAVVGVAIFDLLPEAFRVYSGNPGRAALLVGTGFLLYLLLDRLLLVTQPAKSDLLHGRPVHSARGALGAASLVVHSLMDGLSIGFGFQISSGIGVAIATSVLVHDFSDGINTINVVLKNGGSARRALRWLLADAVVPVIGIAVASFVRLPERWLGVFVALLAGFFLHLGASDLVPESHHRHPKLLTTISTLLGAALMYVVQLYVQ
jgi:zinc transporter ZupT